MFAAAGNKKQIILVIAEHPWCKDRRVLVGHRGKLVKTIDCIAAAIGSENDLLAVESAWGQLPAPPVLLGLHMDIETMMGCCGMLVAVTAISTGPLVVVTEEVYSSKLVADLSDFDATVNYKWTRKSKREDRKQCGRQYVCSYGELQGCGRSAGNVHSTSRLIDGTTAYGQSGERDEMRVADPLFALSRC